MARSCAKLMALLCLLLPVPTAGAITTTAATDAMALAQALAGSGVTVQSAALRTHTVGVDPIGQYSGAALTGFESGIVLSTGNIGLVRTAADPEYVAVNSVDNGGGSDSDMLFTTPGHPDPTSVTDVASLTLDVVAAGTNITLPYIFGSEEYANDSSARYEDRMAIFVNGQYCGVGPQHHDFVTTLTFSSTFNPLYVNNSGGAPGVPGFYGYSSPDALHCVASTTPGAVTHLKIAVADVADHAYDTGVLLPLASLTSDAVPTAALSPASASGKAPLNVAFTTAGSADPEGPLAGWSLDYGDGTVVSGSGAPPGELSHTYSEGTRAAKLTVTDGAGQQGTATAAVTSVTNVPPSASFAVDPTSPRVGDTVHLKPTVSDPDGDPAQLSYAWDLNGDGTVGDSTTREPTTSFPTAGARTLLLVVTDPEGASVTAFRTISVGGPALFAGTLAKVPARARIGQALAGIPLSVTCSAACSVVAKLSIPRADAARAHLKGRAVKGRVAVGNARTTVPAGAPKRFKLRLSSASAKRLRTLRSVKCRLTLTFVAVDGRTATVTRAVKLTR